MTSATSPSRAPHWGLIVLAIVGLVVLSPFILALLFTGLAITIGVAAVALKVGAVVLVIWGLVALCRALFGAPKAQRLPPPPPVRHDVNLRPDIDAELEREKREHLAALDRELARAVARKSPDASDAETT